jgi:ATP-dependent Clp protease ATP-binding subunit ClpA
MLQVIINLVTQGKHQFSERYTARDGNLVQATGALLQSSVSEMASNEKYFAFITSLSENKIEDRFGAKFMDRVADIIVMDAYTEDEILAVTKKMLFDLRIKVQTDLSYSLDFSKAFAAY